MPDWYETYFGEEYLAFHPELRAPEPSWEDVAFLERVLGLEEPRRILDLGCGQGRHALALAKKGHEVTGLDLSRILLARAREAAQRLGVEVRWVQGRMEALDGLGHFDVVLSLYVAFGYYGDEGDLKVLEAVSQVLEPGGLLVLGLSNAAGALRRIPAVTWWERDDAVLYERDDYDPLSGWVTIHRKRFPKTGGVVDLGPARIRAYLPYEVDRMFESVGLIPDLLFGDYRGSPYDWLQSEHQIHVARKPIDQS